jgi:Kef-type K+ transport system membrane component KefB/Trk K+ transport system NAD-binding subunit
MLSAICAVRAEGFMFDAASLPLFYQIAALLALASLVGLIGVTLRQPLVVSYIAVGLIAGPSALGIVDVSTYIELLAELGVAVLLFLVGLKLDVNLIRSVGAVAVATGIGQILFTALIGFALGLALGLDWLTSLYVAVALTFSSTIIIVKLLSDKGEIDSLHGRIALGFLIVQDIVVVIALVALSSAGIGAAGHDSPFTPTEAIGLAVLLVLLVALFVRFLANPVVRRLARSPELLVSFAIGWAALLATVGDYTGFGKELGGLLAGVSLASTPFREAISARLSSLRDFLLLFFFIALGAQLDLRVLGNDIVPAVVLSLFVLIGNPLIVIVIMGAMGYRSRTGFLAGLTVAQISEFSLIFIAMGLTIGHVDERAVGLVTLVGLVTIAASVYMILYSQTLYAWVEPLLKVFERRSPHREVPDQAPPVPESCEVIVLGLGRYGGAMLRLLAERGRRVFGVDFSPETFLAWQAQGYDAMYGDITDPELVAELPLSGVGWIICTIPDHDLGLSQADPRINLLHALHDAGYQGRVAVAAHRPASVQRLQDAGVDLVLSPFRDAAEMAVELVLGQVEPHDFDIIDPSDQQELADSR